LTAALAAEEGSVLHLYPSKAFLNCAKCFVKITIAPCKIYFVIARSLRIVLEAQLTEMILAPIHSQQSG